MTDDQIRKAFSEFRISIGKPAIAPAPEQDSVTYAHFRAGCLVGTKNAGIYKPCVVDREALRKAKEEEDDLSDAL